MEPLIFDTVGAVAAQPAGLSHDGARHEFDVELRHVIDGREVARARVRAHMTSSAIGAAMLPVSAYVARRVESIAGTLNDGKKLERLLQRVASEGGSLCIGRPADVQDYGQPLPPRSRCL
jgi:hypothetical protein